MNIVMVTTTYPTPVRPYQGAFNRVLVNALRADHRVSVIAPIPWRQAGKKRDAGSIRSDEKDTLHPIYYYPPKLMRRYYDRFYWQSIRPSLDALSDRGPVDLVVAYWLHPDGAAARRVADHYGAPYIVISGGTDLRLLTQNRARRRAIQGVIENSDRLIVVSEELAQKAIELGTKPEKLDIIYRGVDRSVFRKIDQRQARDACDLDRDCVVMFWAGRLEPVKNPVLLLEAARHWRDHWGDRLRVVIAGEGSLRASLHRLCRQYGLNNTVRFEGNLPQHQLALRYNAADLVVLTSHSEGVPNVLLESVACGTPFVATSVGGVPEIATPGLDVLVADDDRDGLVAAVQDRVGSMNAATRIFTPMDVQQMAERFGSVFEQVVHSANKPNDLFEPHRQNMPNERGFQRAIG